MPTRAALLLLAPALALALAPAVPASAASATDDSLQVTFRPPADFQGDAHANGTWVALFFGAGGEAGLAAAGHPPADVVDHSYAAADAKTLDLVDLGNARAPEPRDTTTAGVGPFSLGFAGREGSLLLHADRIDLALEGTTGRLLTRGASDALPPLVDLESDRNPYWYFHGRPTRAGAMVAAHAAGATPFRLEADGLRSAVWFGAAVHCEGDPCPSGGGRDMADVALPGGGASAGTYSYVEAAFGGGRLAGSGTLATAVLLGPTLDLSVLGTLRLPLASGAPVACGACLAPDGQTLQVDGGSTLRGVARQPDGSMQAALAGDFGAARFDEAPVDPARLAGFGGAAAVAGAAVLWLLKPFVTPLFTRMTKEEAMDHPNRRKLYEAIEADPGIGFREVARQAGLAAGTARHHLNVLCRHGLLQEERHRFTQRFFPGTARLDPVAVARGVLLRDPQLARLHAVVEACAWITQSDLIDLMAADEGWTRSTTQHRLARLVSGGLVQVRQQGRFQLHAIAGTVHPQDAAKPALPALSAQPVPPVPPAQPLASQYPMRPKPSSM